MFQSFQTDADPAQGIERVARLRRLMGERGLDGFLIPRADEHQGEYVAACSERLSWLTGFTGSAGVALVLAESALIFVDGRYTLQARKQVDPDTFAIESLVENPPSRWLAANASAGARIGFDPWLHTISEAKALRAALQKRDATLVPVAKNLVDAIWPDRPAPPSGKVELHPQELAGESAKNKLARLARAVEEAGADCAVLTDPSSLAWAFNIRGSDVPHTPLALGFALIDAKGRHAIFMAPGKLSGEVVDWLGKLASLGAPEALEDEVRKRAADGGRIALDPALAAERLRLLVAEAGGEVVEAPDPAQLPRAVKNRAELDGARAAHRRDGAAMTRFLHWLDGCEPGTVDEIAAAVALERFRREAGEAAQMKLRDISFDTISGAGPNGAIIHYRVTDTTNRKLEAGELYLVDSGGQYRDGTTDITRTVAVGRPSAGMRRHYTLVLKGLIAVSLSRFPPGTRGQDIDPFARRALWQAGLDYAHGTGHGVGSYLAVHEGPQRIARTGSQKLLAGMILSNEPGYYKEGAYGIRLENLIVVTPPEEIEGGETAMHGFETLTLAPFERRLIETELLSHDEREWLDTYHARVLAEIAPMLEGKVREWLETMTAPL